MVQLDFLIALSLKYIYKALAYIYMYLYLILILLKKNYVMYISYHQINCTEEKA